MSDPDPYIRGRGSLQKKNFRPVGPQFGLKIRSGTEPGPPGHCPFDSVTFFCFVSDFDFFSLQFYRRQSTYHRDTALSELTDRVLSQIREAYTK